MPKHKHRPFRNGAVLLGGEQPIPTGRFPTLRIAVNSAASMWPRINCLDAKRFNWIERLYYQLMLTAKRGTVVDG